MIMCRNVYGCSLEQKACCGESCHFSIETILLKLGLVFAALYISWDICISEKWLPKCNMKRFSSCKACLDKTHLLVDVLLMEYLGF